MKRCITLEASATNLLDRDSRHSMCIQIMFRQTKINANPIVIQPSNKIVQKGKAPKKV